MNGSTSPSLFVTLNFPEAEAWEAILRSPDELEVEPRLLREVLEHRRRLDSTVGRRRLGALFFHFMSRASEQSYALARSVIEWARLRSAENGDRAALDEAEELLATPRLDAIDPCRAAELRLLIEAYRADDARCDGDVLGAEAALARLRPRLDVAAPEIHALVLELESDLASHGRLIDEADLALERAEKKLAGVEIPGRRASLHLRRGRLRLKMGRLDAARSAFEAARRSVPPGVDERQRLEAGHCLVATHVAMKNFAEAEKLMDSIRASYALWSGDRSLEAQRCGLEGRIHLHFGRHEAADGQLEKAFDLFLEIGAVRDAFRTFDDLLESALASGHLETRRGSLEEQVRRLLEAPSLSEMAYVEALRYLGRAERQGIHLPELSRLAERLLPTPYAAS